MRALLVTAASLAVLCAACGDAAGAPEDGGPAADGAGSDGGTLAAPPQEPAPPAIDSEGSCPEGWLEPTAEPRTCEPWPVDEPACPDDLVRFPGESACAALDGPCGSDGFADDLPTDAPILFVRPGSAGTGGRTDPMGTIADAVAAATAGTTIALGAAPYEELVRLPAGVAIHGACSSDTSITTTTASDTGAVITVLGAGSALRRLRIVDAPRVGIGIGARASATLDRVWIEGVRQFGVLADPGSTLTGRRLLIRGTVIRPADFGSAIALDEANCDLTDISLEANFGFGFVALGPGNTVHVERAVVRGTRDAGTFRGRGAQVQDGADVVLSQTVLEGNQEFSLVATDATVVRLSEVVVRDSRVPAFGTAGVALQVQGGATIDADHTLIDGSTRVGVNAVGDGSTIVLRDTVVRETGSGPDGRSGVAVQLMDGSAATLSRTVVGRSRAAGVDVDTGSSATLEDVSVVDTLGEEADGDWGRGIQVAQGSSAELRRVRVERSGITGVYVGAATLDAEDLTVRETVGNRSDGLSGRGLSVESGGSAIVRRIVVEDSGDVAVASLLAGSTVDLSDAVIRGTRGREVDGTVGYGAAVQDGGAMTLTRAVLSEHRTIGVFTAGADASASLTDVAVRDMLGQPSDGTGGRGVVVQEGARMTGTRLRVERAREGGILALSGAAVALEQIEVLDTLGRACGETTCAEAPGGHGLAAVRGTLEATDVLITRSALCGLLIASEGELDLVRGVVSDGRIGACVQVPDYDVARITQDVRYLDNDLTLETTSLPIPELSNPVGAAEESAPP